MTKRLKPDFENYASSPDSKDMFPLQREWIEFSHTIILTLSEHFKRRKCFAQDSLVDDFESLLKFLGKKRNTIAHSLGHGKYEDEGVDRTDEYGTLRPPDQYVHEPFYEKGYPEQPWLKMIPKIFAIVDTMTQDIIAKIEAGKLEIKVLKRSKVPVITVSDADRSITLKKSAGKMTFVDMQIFAPHSAHDQYTKNLSLTRRNIAADVDGKPTRYITIIYARVRECERRGNFAIANEYLHGMLNCPDGEIGLFLLHAGKFCHIMAHILPFKLGTAGITEWIIRGAAYANGIELGQFDYNSGISWDFKALLTPNRDEYANWFKDHVFVAPCSLCKTIPNSKKMKY